jgi:hypothetical protein
MTTTTTSKPARQGSPGREPYVRSFEPAKRMRRLFRIGNAMLRPVLRSALGRRMTTLAVLSFEGRRTGRRYSVPVSYYELAGRGLVLTASGWRFNFRGGADVWLTRAGRTVPARAALTADPDDVADVYQALLGRDGVKGSRKFGVVLAGDRMPTHEELVEAIGGRRGVVWLAPR